MPVENSSTLVDHWFSSVRGVSSDTLARLRGAVQHKLDAGACKDMVAKMPPEYAAAAELQFCLNQVISEQWDFLSPEERLLVFCPSVKAVGEQGEIPKRGTGILVRRELTRRFGIEMTFRLKDDSLFTWEFFD